MALVLAGCLASFDGNPRRLFSVDEELRELRIVAPIAEIAHFEATNALLSEKERIARRNEIIAARMYAIDVNYHEFEAALRRERQQLGFWSSAALVGLTGSATLVAAAATKTALEAAATILAGSTSAFKDEVLFRKTIDVLLTQMQAKRTFVAAHITEKMQTRSVADYPLGFAMTDVEEYYAAGTINGALVEIGKTVGKEADRADEAKANVRSYVYAPDMTARILKEYLYPRGPVAGEDPTSMANLLAYLKAITGRTDINERDLIEVLDDPRASRLRNALLDRARKAGQILR